MEPHRSTGRPPSAAMRLERTRMLAMQQAGHSVREIAQALGLKQSTANMRLSRAREEVGISLPCGPYSKGGRYRDATVQAETQRMVQMRAEGMTIQAIADSLNISKAAASMRLAQARKDKDRPPPKTRAAGDLLATRIEMLTMLEAGHSRASVAAKFGVTVNMVGKQTVLARKAVGYSWRDKRQANNDAIRIDVLILIKSGETRETIRAETGAPLSLIKSIRAEWKNGSRPAALKPAEIIPEPVPLEEPVLVAAPVLRIGAAARCQHPRCPNHFIRVSLLQSRCRRHEREFAVAQERAVAEKQLAKLRARARCSA